jgi:hypothetical protein
MKTFNILQHPGSSSISAHDKRLGAVSGFSKNFGKLNTMIIGLH